MALSRLADRVGVAPESALVVGLISGSQFANHAFLVLLPPILPVLAGEFEVSLALLGAVLGAGALANTAMQLPFGYLADRYDRTVALALSSVLGAVGAVVTALAPSVPVLVAGQVILGVGVGGHHPAHYPLLTDATPEHARGRAFSVYNFGGSLGFATPPVVITAVVAVPGLTWRHAVGLLGVAGLVYAVVLTVVFARRVDDEVTAPNVEATASEAPLADRVRAELRALAAQPGILGMAVLALVSSTASWGVTSYAVVFLTDAYRLPLDIANLALTGLFVVGAGAILVGGSLTDRFGGGRVLVASFAGFAVLVGLLAARLVPAAAAVALLLSVGGVRSMAGPARDALTERLAGRGDVGKSFAVVTVGVMLGSAVAPPAFGYLIETAGVGAAFAAIAAVGLLATAVTVALLATVVDGGPAPSPAD